MFRAEPQKVKKFTFLSSRNQENRFFGVREIKKVDFFEFKKSRKSTFSLSGNPQKINFLEFQKSKKLSFLEIKKSKKKTHTHKSAVRRCSPTAAAQMCSCTSVIFLTPERPQTVPGLLSSVGGTRDLSLRSRGGPSSDARSPYSPYSSVFAPSSDAWSP